MNLVCVDLVLLNLQNFFNKHYNTFLTTLVGSAILPRVNPIHTLDT